MRQRLVVSQGSDGTGRAVLMGAALFSRFVRTVSTIHGRDLSAFGLFISSELEGGDELHPTDAVFFERQKKRCPWDLRELQARARRRRELLIAPFHSHRRQAADFSMMDYEEHNPLFGWHLVVSMRDPLRPVVQPFSVDKPLDRLGTGDGDPVSEVAYRGSDVSPILLLVEGRSSEIDGVQRLLRGAAPDRSRDATDARGPDDAGPDDREPDDREPPRAAGSP